MPDVAPPQKKNAKTGHQKIAKKVGSPAKKYTFLSNFKQKGAKKIIG